jgi:hypothetical protein
VLADHTADILNRLSREKSPCKLNDGYDVYLKKVMMQKVPNTVSMLQSPRTRPSSRSSSPTKKHLHTMTSSDSNQKGFSSPKRRVKHNCIACLKNHGPEPCDNCECEEKLELFIEESPPRNKNGRKLDADEVLELIDLINNTVKDLEHQERSLSPYGLKPPKKIPSQMQDSIIKMVDHGNSLIDRYEGNTSRSSRPNKVLQNAADLKGVLLGVKQQLLRALNGRDKRRILNDEKVQIGNDLTHLERRIAANLDKLTQNSGSFKPRVTQQTATPSPTKCSLTC